MKKIASSKVMKKYLISVPKAVREALDVRPGDYVDWFVDGGRIVIKKRSEKE